MATNNMKEFKVPIPEGMEIDKEKSTFECIKFKPIEHKRWRDDENVGVNGYYIYPDSSIKNIMTVITVIPITMSLPPKSKLSLHLLWQE